ncbi:MAG TPA: class I SAM-dependent methyltransferase [Blastocatellia bacterium]|nr:class I SAM-dependent methyltransferase [Blastocatellia bacterium]
MDLKKYQTSYPLMARVCAHLVESRPIYKRMLSGLIQTYGRVFWENGEARCREILHLCDGDADRFLASVYSWTRFSLEHIKRQQAFLEKRAYATTDFETVLHTLYEDSGEMKGYYLPALMYSYIFSANYIGFLAFFQNEVLPRIKKAGKVLDAGCGAGVYLTQMLLEMPGASGTGLDISPASLETTARLMDYHSVAPERYQLIEGDLRRRVPVEDASQDAVVCCEVLEHLDDPAFALGELRRLLKPGGVLCLSAAIRMESIDHIHLFSHPGEVKEMLQRDGLEIIIEDFFPLTATAVTEPSHRARLIDDPNVALGYIALVSKSPSGNGASAL